MQMKIEAVFSSMDGFVGEYVRYPWTGWVSQVTFVDADCYMIMKFKWCWMRFNS